MNLKALLPAVFLISGFAPISKAQVFEEGAISVSAGYGFGNVLSAAFQTYTLYDEYELKSFGPIFVKGEYGVSDRIGLGVSVAHNQYHATFRDNIYDYDYAIDYTSTSFLVRFNGHFLDHDKADLYYGFGIGYRIGGWSFESDDEFFDFTRTAFPIGMESTLGFRYMFTDNIGAYMETGMAKGILQLGVTGRF